MLRVIRKIVSPGAACAVVRQHMGSSCRNRHAGPRFDVAAFGAEDFKQFVADNDINVGAYLWEAVAVNPPFDEADTCYFDSRVDHVTDCITRGGGRSPSCCARRGDTGVRKCRSGLTKSGGNLGSNQSQVKKRWGVSEHNSEVANRL